MTNATYLAKVYSARISRPKYKKKTLVASRRISWYRSLRRTLGL